MKIGSLFSGYGGLDLAVETVFNAQPAWFCEFDEAPSKILAHHWPNIPNHHDVTTVNWEEVEPIDILTGGSPCQDLSHAGKRAGMTEGTRSNLWVNMREAIAALQPQYVVWENVLGALSATATSDSDMEQGQGLLANPRNGHLRALGRVLGDLTEIGYDARWTTLRASDIGAPTIVPAYSSSHGPVFSTPDTNPGGGGQLTAKQRREQGRTASVNNAVMEIVHLPTPCAGDNVNDTESQHNRNSPSLTQVSKHFPTPQAVDGIMGRPRTTGRPIEKSTHLTTIVTLLPTPSASDGQRPEDMPSQARRNSPGITAVSAHFPTPAASDSTGGGQHPSKRKGHTVQLIDTVLELSGDNTPPLFDVGNE